MGHNGSWISPNASEQHNASGAEGAGVNRSALGEFGEAQLYRQFTTTVQVVIFIGSLLAFGAFGDVLGQKYGQKQPGDMTLPMEEWPRGSVVTRELYMTFGCLC
ncbi:hypothetical protein H8959_016088 [Pygathrix nigripes]